jgi:hypothetical protein
MTVYRRFPAGLAVGLSFIELLMQPHAPELKMTMPPAAPTALRNSRLPDIRPSLILGCKPVDVKYIAMTTGEVVIMVINFKVRQDETNRFFILTALFLR